MGIIAIMKNRLRQKKREYKLRGLEAARKLGSEAEKLLVQNRFIGALTHEMRNFVTTYGIQCRSSRIVANSELLKETETWNAATVGDLAEAASYLSKVLTNTLDISKLNEGKVEFNREYESARKVVDVVFSVARTNAQKKSVVLEASYSSTLPALVEFDKTRLTQIVMNCVGNAVKFCKDSGKVLVKVFWYWDCGRSGGDCSICDGSRVNDEDLDSSRLGTPTEELKEGEVLRYRDYVTRVY